MLDHILMNNTTIDVVQQPPSALALNQLSEHDRRLVAKLKDTYPSHILESVFGEAIMATDRMGRREYHSPRESTASSTLYLGTASIDGDTCSSSTASRSSYGSHNSQETSLYKRRALSQTRSRSVSTSRARGPLPRTGSVSSIQQPKEIRITITKPQPIANPSSMPSTEIKTLFFCTTCQASFQEQGEWQAHEDEAHERQYFWPCPADSCDKVFTEEALFTKHHTEDHDCEECNHAEENQRPLPSKRSWGCGFDRCKGFFNDWETRCDHVAAHFESLAREDDTSSQPSEWKYTNIIKNLLRQDDVKDAYRKVMIKSHGNDKVFWPRMGWQPETSKELKRRLEYRDFREGVQELARMACQLGHPAQAEAVKIVRETAVDAPEPAKAPAPANIPPPLPSPGFLNPKQFMHIDKFPRPGQNPFDVYGPVPPSPIINLDFLSESKEAEESKLLPPPPVTRPTLGHTAKSSLSAIPYSLYPSSKNETPLPTPPVPESAPVFTSPRSSIRSPRDSTMSRSSSTHVTSPSILADEFLSEGPLSSASIHPASSLGSPVSPNDLPFGHASPSSSSSFAWPPRTSSKDAQLHSGATSPVGSVSPPRPRTPKSIFGSAKSLMRKRSKPDLGSAHARPALVISEPFDAAAAMRRIQEYKGPETTEVSRWD